MKVNKKSMVVFLSIFLLSFACMHTLPLACVRGYTIHHVYPGQSIQDAINLAQSGDTIFVHSGTYYENWRINVNKTVSLVGENKYTTVVDFNVSTTSGCFMVTANHTEISGFMIRHGSSGVYIGYGSWMDGIICGVRVSGNILKDNSQFGIGVGYSHDNMISGNTIISNSEGFHCGCPWSWPSAPSRSPNIIYHNNFIDNTMNVFSTAEEELWDDGYPSGGNYWSDYDGVDRYSGPSQDELSSDGIGDTPYVINENNTDLYPLMVPWGTTPYYDWPMFHHDPRHTGYSTSTAPNTNNTIWNRQTGGGVFSSPAVVDDRIFVASWDGKVYCLNATTGIHIWNYTTGDWVWSSPAVAYGLVYIGTRDHNFYAFNATTGTKKWSYTTGSGVFSSPAVADGRVYVGSNDYNIYCLNAETGLYVWSYTTGSNVTSSPAVADGKVYVGSLDNKVYAFGPSSPPVGGIYVPVNKLELLAPYIGLTILLAVAVMAVVHVKKRKRT